MQKVSLLISFLSLTAILQAQPRCFIVGPAYNMGSTSISNFTFSRLYNPTGLNGVPTTEFSNFGDTKTKNSAAGLYTDIYLKRCRIAFDFMYPFKNSAANTINFNLAFGGYIKGKVGILAGISMYQNAKNLNLTATDGTAVPLTLTSEYNTSGYFYNGSNMAGGAGANLLLTYAPNEKFVFRIDYGFYASEITHKKTGEPENYEWDHQYSRKIEAGVVWQFAESFGLAAKFFTWTTTGTYTADASYTDISGGTSTVNLAIFPERTYKSNNFTICLMIPLGNASSTSGTITVTPVN